MRSKWCKLVLSLALVIGNIFTSSILYNAFAQQTEQTEEVSESERDYLQWQLKRMEELFQKQQEQIQALKNRIEALSVEKPPVTKEEIKHEIEDYLATDEARKKMGLGLPTLVSAFTPDEEKYSLVMRSPDDRYSLGIGGRLQFRYTFKDNDEDFGKRDTNNIDVRRARLALGGNVYSKLIHYYIELDGDSFDVGIRDFYVYWTPLEEFNAKIGYFKVPFNQQRMTTSAKLLFQDRSIASEQFDQDRDYGFDIYGKPFDGYMEYHAAIFQGAGENPEDRGTDDNLDNELMYVFNVRYNPFGKYDTVDESDLKFTEKFKASVAASVVVNPKERDEKLVDSDGILGVVELSMKYKGISWHNEYFMRSDDPESGGDSVESDGFFTQAGYFVIPKRLEVAARYSMLEPDKDVSDDIGREYTGGINYYFRGHRSKIQADVGHFVTDGKEEDKRENRFRVQYQIIF
ncbi:MAG: porin [Candidatus Brocadia sp.]